MANKKPSSKGSKDGKQLSTGLFFPSAKVFFTDSEVEDAATSREEAKAVRELTNKGLRYLLSQANHAIKTHKAVNNAHKMLMKFGLVAHASDASLSVAQRRADLAGEAIDHKTEVQITAAETRQSALLGAISQKYASVKGTTESKALPWRE